jgi:hypothetical protein
MAPLYYCTNSVQISRLVSIWPGIGDDSSDLKGYPAALLRLRDSDMAASEQALRSRRPR